MTPDEIASAYEVLAGNLRDKAAQEAAIIGNSQRSLGLLAAQVASPSGQTYGLANYTYNRTMRPAVDAAVQNLITTGNAQRLDQYLTDQLRTARQRYENSRNAGTTTASNGGGGNEGPYTEKTDQDVNVTQVKPPEAGTLLGVGSTPPIASNGIEALTYGPNARDYIFTIADGKGGSYNKIYRTDSQNEAYAKFYEEFPNQMWTRRAQQNLWNTVASAYNVGAKIGGWNTQVPLWYDED